MRMDAIPCRLVFLALFFGARIQHTDGTSSSLCVCVCVCVCARVCSRARLGSEEGCSLFASNCSPKRVFLLRWRRSETDREMLSAQASLFRHDREERRRKSFKAPHLIALGTARACVCVCVRVCVCVWSIHV